ncbi:hypothetical protein ZHAS_00014315 [Anopheles sinensis]|uniref:Uncharacterized protein n=1 Tax=Anopheles sinensis TaxID=74873 RepID=A0A084W7Y0_ANOSI|nr:hypothetical protein ZHAS_00014315 [Anopheles sinensis]
MGAAKVENRGSKCDCPVTEPVHVDSLPGKWGKKRMNRSKRTSVRKEDRRKQSWPPIPSADGRHEESGRDDDDGL